MTNFPRTRIAVNLWLIVVMMIQPVAYVWAASGCAASGGNGDIAAGLSAAVDSGAGCGCCQADDGPTGGCCCCQPTMPPPPSDSEPTEQLAGDSLHLVCCATSRPQRRSSLHTAQGERPLAERDLAGPAGVIESLDQHQGLRSVCFCNRSGPPLSDPAPQRGSSDLRGELSVAATDLAWTSPRSSIPKSSRHVVRGLLPEHFSQVHLCIWRL